MIENRDKLIHIHDNEVNNISEFNLLHDIINPPKRAKNLNIHYSPIIHGWMNIKNFLHFALPLREFIHTFRIMDIYSFSVFGIIYYIM